ncbi:lipase/serine esteras-like protein [Saccharata proteae CBS 121410]|uniref:Lipase/serine esteras-like protein n=1 Tax=Saccharata proteae CBS 121410 TaxID=1314787 RepID=A0A9P4HT10_9PEZI|nr:lipase/serine esteras-like protein [Saccharata proteae CBS 121410]
MSNPTISSSSSTSSKSANHLCVLVHGLWGNPSHLSYVSEALREKYPEDKLHILLAKRNAGSFTYDGIELGGERITHEIEEALEELARNGQTITKLSMVGYSLGGLISRYAIGLLYHKGWFDKIEPVNFTTFASPHLGVRTPLVGFWNHLWNVLGARTLSTSGRQLFTIDKFRDTSRPLLSVLADPDSVFIHGLSKFKHRTLYTNIVNDRSAVYYTTGISRTDPYVNLDNLKINYLKGYEPIVLDPARPVSRKEDEELPTFYQRLAGGSTRILGRVPFVVFLVIFVPIASILFLINSGVQSVRSRRRIRLHEEGKAGIGLGAYSIPLLVNDVRREAEHMFEGINNTQDSEYLPAGTEELAGPPSPQGSDLATEKTPLVDKDADTAAEGPRQQQRQLDFPTLALTADQFAMIQALDDVGFKKYPVHIHKVRHSHAAIIKRLPRASYDEGEVVVRHWLSEFEI